MNHEDKIKARALANAKHQTLIAFSNFSQRLGQHVLAEFEHQASVFRPDEIDPGSVIGRAVKAHLAELYSEMMSAEVDEFMAAVEPPE